MMIWKISQDVNTNFDTFSSAVVIAPDETAARLIHPGGEPDEWNTYEWAAPALVKVELLGVATGNAVPGVVCAVFHAG